MNDESVLFRLELQGQAVPRVHLEGDGDAPSASPERYEIVGEIARGGVGVVYKGRDADLGRDVAMKVLRDEFLASPEAVQRFVEEAQIGGQLQHPGIVPVYELGLHEQRRPFFAMKLVKGRTLADLLTARAGPGDRRRELLAHFTQACHTMSYAHSRGVIHRDLKPSNVMVGGFGEVQVVDWGFARVLARGGVADERRSLRAVTVVATVRSAAGGGGSVAGSVVGTPAYMPPEQALGRVEEMTERADVFALGAILCEILTGAPPYAGPPDERLAAAAEARLDDAYARIESSDADPELKRLVRACIAPLPKDRPRSAREVAQVLASYLGGVERRAHQARVRALEAEAEAEEQQRSRRHTLVLVAASLLAVLLGGAALLAAERVRADRDRVRVAAYQAAVLEATRLAAGRDWSSATAAAERARGLALDDAPRSTEAEALGERITADAEAAARAEEKAAAERVLLARLDEVLLHEEGDPDPTRTDDAYAAALPDLSPLADFDRRAHLASHLDRWADLRRREPSLEGRNWRELDETARALDPDPWRTGLRDALSSGDLEALRTLATGAAVSEQPAPSADVLAVALGERGAAEVALDLLRRTESDHPENLAVHLHLARFALRHGAETDPDARDGRQEAFEHLTVALALRPTDEVRRLLDRLR